LKSLCEIAVTQSFAKKALSFTKQIRAKHQLVELEKLNILKEVTGNQRGRDCVFEIIISNFLNSWTRLKICDVF
jgi:hypothetical protein